MLFSILDRFLIRSFFKNFFVSAAAFVLIMLVVDGLSIWVYKNAAFDLVLFYLMYQAPELLYQLVPVATLFGMLFTLGGLNRTSELVALYSCGVSLIRIAAPLFCSALFLSATMLWMSDQILPWVVPKKQYIYHAEILKKPYMEGNVRKNKIWYRVGDTVFYLQTLDVEKRQAELVNIFRFSENWTMNWMVSARRAKIGDGLWILENGSETLLESSQRIPLVRQFEQIEVSMPVELEVLERSVQPVKTLGLRELRAFIDANRQAGLHTVRYEVDYYSKFGFALAGIVMSLVGVPLSLRRNRAGGFWFFLGVCLFFVVVYWILYNMGLALGIHGYLPPLLATSGVNIIMGLLGALLFWSRRQ